jgi:hypothetical protein
LRYSDFVVPLVKAVQELSKANDDKDAKIDDLQKQIDALKAMITLSGQQMQANNQKAFIPCPLGAGVSSLEQNIPNPFANTTIIPYTLPQKFSSAQIIITDKNGKALKQVNLPAGRQGVSGKGSLNVDASMLSAGAYNYSLYVDGRLIGSKQMIAVK